MGKQESFAKLTEDLEKLSKAEEVVEEPKAEDEVKEEEIKAEEEVVEEPKAEEPAQPEIPEVVPQVVAEEVVAPEPEIVEEPKAEEEEVEKAAKCPDCGKPKADCTCKDDDKDKDDDKKDDKKDKKDDKVKKSADEISEVDFIGAFEAVVKSFGSVKEELASVKSEFANFMTFVKDNMVMKSTEPVEEVAKSEEVVEEAPVEEVSKSVEEEPEGKAVEFIAKSEDGVPVEEPVVEEEAPKEFVASEHVSAVTDYFMKNAHQLDPGRQSFIRAAVQRVKRGQAGQPDIDLFKEIVNFNENSEN